MLFPNEDVVRRIVEQRMEEIDDAISFYQELRAKKEQLVYREHLSELKSELNTEITNTLSCRLSPFQQMLGQFKLIRWAVGLAIVLLLKSAFAPNAWTYTPEVDTTKDPVSIIQDRQNQ